MTRKLGAAALLCLFCALPAQAETLDINVGSDAFRAQFSGPLARALEGTDGEYQFGGLFHSGNSAEQVTNLFGGLMLTGDTGATTVNLRGGLGVRLQYTDAGHDTGGGAAIGGQFAASLPGAERLSLQGYAFYQPKVLGLGDIDDQFEWALSLGYEVLRNASLYLGYRELRVNPENRGSYTADDTLHLGLTLKF